MDYLREGSMDKSYKNILINSTLAFIAAFIFTTFIHEFGHFISYSMFGANPTLFHNYVQTPDQILSLHVKVISALAGPIFSLLQGFVFVIIVYKNHKNSAAHLFYLWVALLGFVNFFGYLLMTPLSTAGDTGKVAGLLSIDYSVRIMIAIVGFALLIWIILKIGRNFSNFIPEQHNLKKKAKYVYHIMFFPIMIGGLVNTLLAFPVVAILSIIYPATSSYVIMSSFGSILKASNQQAISSEIEDKINKSLILLTIFAIIFNRLLTLGVG